MVLAQVGQELSTFLPMVNSDNVFSWLVTAFFFVVFLLLAFESWALLTGHTPISDYVRPAVHAFPGYAFVIAVIIGILVGHFLWGPASGRVLPRSLR
jgi:EamA domain-containing membrane protein RarD